MEITTLEPLSLDKLHEDRSGLMADRIVRYEGFAVFYGHLCQEQFISTLKTYGVKVWSYQEAWTEAPGELAEVLYAIAGWVARMESQRRSERTKAGLARLKALGKKLGRPKGSKDKKRRRKR